ncbi:DUF2785 domain-containing protein [Paenisporosarcina cavernae]|uniref:DUF2785 domain-containing protein n=1 Tax=Paenisporosarcina cavernae TaxID=2320858 RepID=A0A385YW33_9BACL|nr:DUF2785 domain-containing protein [Paenisporosarcina cavernae]AYC30500.1 DUF2785 domain-containing protein [Paenisporosarcina cavernae]
MQKLKATLEHFIETNEIEISQPLLENMMENIGNTDAYLRDKLIFTSFYYFFDRGLLTSDQIEFIVERLVKEKLLVKGIHYSSSDDVFTRSFSSLLVALIFYFDAKSSLVKEEVLLPLIEDALLSIQLEKDTRGYVGEKGWAHAVAHSADMIASLAMHPLVKNTQKRQLLEGIERFLLLSSGYVDEEEDRLAFAFLELGKNHFTASEITKWLEELKHKADQLYEENKSTVESYYPRVAVRRFVTAAYFKLKKDEPENEMAELLHSFALELY